MIRVLVVDDHPKVRQSIARLLDELDDIECVATAADGVDALPLVDAHAPDVVVMDISMPRLDGIAATIMIRATRPSTQVVVFTGLGTPEIRSRVAEAGAAGYVLKDSEPEELVSAIRAAAA